MNRHEHLLVIAIEECNELAQRLSKALRFGLDEVQPGQPLNNTERIRYEYSDLAATLEMIAPPTAAGGTIHPPSGKAMDAKREKVEHFLKYSAEVGTLSLGAPPHADAPPQTEEAVIEHVVAHWFTQGGTAQFGDLDLPSFNADGVVSAILTAVRAKLNAEFAVFPRSERSTSAAASRESVSEALVADAPRSTPAPDLKVLREAWDHGVKIATSYGDNIGHLQGSQADCAFRGFLDSLHVRSEGDVPAQQPATIQELWDAEEQFSAHAGHVARAPKSPAAVPPGAADAREPAPMFECDQCGTKSSDWDMETAEGVSCPRHYLDDDSCDGTMRNMHVKLACNNTIATCPREVCECAAARTRKLDAEDIAIIRRAADVLAGREKVSSLRRETLAFELDCIGSAVAPAAPRDQNAPPVCKQCGHWQQSATCQCSPADELRALAAELRDYDPDPSQRIGWSTAYLRLSEFRHRIADRLALLAGKEPT